MAVALKHYDCYDGRTCHLNKRTYREPGVYPKVCKQGQYDFK